MAVFYHSLEVGFLLGSIMYNPSKWSFYFYNICIGVFLYVCLFEDIRSLGIGDPDSCELSFGCWKLNLAPGRASTVFHFSSPRNNPSPSIDMLIHLDMFSFE